MEKLINRITCWIQRYASSAMKKSLVVGMSGGIDSALVAALCELTRFDVICISMPRRDDNSPSSIRAKNMCDKMKCKFILQPIGGILNGYLNDYIIGETDGKIVNNDKYRIGNLSARIRASILYDAAATYNGLVVGTCNKDEIYTGYFTKGGDGLADIEPIADLHKTHVYVLARALDITHEIIDAIPSAELWDGQTDENEMGVTYDQIEWFINHQGWESILTEEQKQFFYKVKDLYENSMHKRELPPVFKVNPDE